MKIIARTDSGNLIIELTPAEFDRLQSGASPESIAPSAGDLLTWQKDFYEAIMAANVPARPRLRLLRSAGMWPIKTAKGWHVEYKKHSPNERVFVEHGRLLPFAEWRQKILDDEIALSLELEGFGPGMDTELKRALTLAGDME